MVKSETIQILLMQGLSSIKFGATTDELISIMGKPAEIQSIQEEDMHSTCYVYPAEGYFFYFDSDEQLDLIEIENDEVELFQVDVFFLTKKEVIFLMESKGYKLSEEEVLSADEGILYFDSACIDFYFEKNQLSIITLTRDYNTSF